MEIIHKDKVKYLRLFAALRRGPKYHYCISHFIHAFLLDGNLKFEKELLAYHIATENHVPVYHFAFVLSRAILLLRAISLPSFRDIPS